MAELQGTGIIRQETEHTTMMLKDGIFYMYYKPIKLLSLPIVQTIVQERLAFKQGVSYPTYVNIRKLEQTTKDARDYLANQGNELVVANAIVVESPVLRMMANFYIMINQPVKPTRMFTDEESALEWLRQYKRYRPRR